MKTEDDAQHRCPNSTCPAQFFELFKHFVSKGAMNIDGLGEKWCAILIDKGLVKDLADLYYLKSEQLLELDRMGEILAAKIMNNIEASKSRPWRGSFSPLAFSTWDRKTPTCWLLDSEASTK